LTPPPQTNTLILIILHTETHLLVDVLEWYIFEIDVRFRLSIIF